jgi:hypothetical protein
MQQAGAFKGVTWVFRRRLALLYRRGSTVSRRLLVAKAVTSLAHHR